MKTNLNKRKTKTKNTKHLNLPNPNKQEYAPPKPPKLGKQTFLTLKHLYQTHKKHTTKTLKFKTWKTNIQKHRFAMFKNNPLFFIDFFQPTYFIATAVPCWKHYKNNVLSKTQFSKTQLVKPLFHPNQRTPYAKKRCHFRFWAISAETTISIIFPGFSLFWAPQKSVQNRKRARKLAFFLLSLPDTNGVRQLLLKLLVVIFLIFWIPTWKTQSLYFWPFSILFSFGLSFSNIKRQKQKGIFFENPHFWHPDKKTILAQIDIFCVFQHPQNTL